MLDIEAESHFLSTEGAELALKIVSALAAWIVGRWLISLLVRGFGMARAAIPNVATTPAPDVEILQFRPEGPLLCVRPHTHTNHYWRVCFDTHKAVMATFAAAGYATPETPISPRSRCGRAAGRTAGRTA